MSALKALKEVIRRITLVKVVSGISVPVITVFEDMISETNNDTITPGKSAKIFGDKLKFDKADADQGILYILQVSGKTTAGELRAGKLQAVLKVA